MRLQRPNLSFAALVIASTMAFGLAGHFAADGVIRHQQAHQLNELTEVVLRRSELAVDFAAASLDEQSIQLSRAVSVFQLSRDAAHAARPALAA